MSNPTKKIRYVRSRPIATGLFTVLGVLIVGVCVAYVAGLTHPLVSFADDLGMDTGLDTGTDTGTDSGTGIDTGIDTGADLTTSIDTGVSTVISDITGGDTTSDDPSGAGPADVAPVLSDDPSGSGPSDVAPVLTDDPSGGAPTDVAPVLSDDPSGSAPADVAPVAPVVTDDPSGAAPTDVDPVIVTAPSTDPDSLAPSDVTPVNTETDEPDTVGPPCCSLPVTTTVDDTTEPDTTAPTDVPPADTTPNEPDTVGPPCCTLPGDDTPPDQQPPVDVPPVIVTPPPTLPIATTTPNNPPPPVPVAPTCTLVASPTSITSGGSSTLSWTTTNATTFSINQTIGSVTPVKGGSTSVSPTNTTTYTGIATGSGGTVTCQTTVTVTTPGGSPTPACTLTASPTSINYGGSSTLTWGGTNISSVSIDNGVGNEGPSGSTSVSPTSNTTYTGTFTSTTGSTLTCQATVVVTTPTGPGCTSNCGGGGGGGTTGGGGGFSGGGGSGQFFGGGSSGQIITAPAAAYVSLSQIPYTGLDLGPIGTVVYWVALIAFCLAAAYLILFKLIPFSYHGLQSFGTSVSQVVNSSAPQLALAGVAGAHTTTISTHTVSDSPAHVSHTPAPIPVVASVQTSGYTPTEGFRSYAKGSSLTIDDIVKGLAREAGVAATAPAVSAYVAAAHAEAAGHEVPAPQMTAPASIAHPLTVARPALNGSQNAPALPTDVRDFIASLLQGDREFVFSTLRQIVREGGDAETFLTQVVCALDDAYRARLEGTKVNPEVAHLTQNCATPFLERLTNALTNAVDSSYSPGISGSKLALTRALAVVEG